MADPELRRHLADDVATMAGVLRRAPAASVRHCPGWAVADLIRHHGDVLLWAAGIVRTGEPGSQDDFVGPDDLESLEQWYSSAGAELIEVLERTEPDRPVWTFGPPPHRAGFWTRRQALEAAIHRWDAEDAAGGAHGFPAAVAVAGIDEVIDMMFPRQIDLERTPPLSVPVRLRATDLDRTWVLPSAARADAVEVELAGPADALLLLLWRRTDLTDDRLALTGSDAVRSELASARFAP